MLIQLCVTKHSVECLPAYVSTLQPFKCESRRNTGVCRLVCDWIFFTRNTWGLAGRITAKCQAPIIRELNHHEVRIKMSNVSTIYLPNFISEQQNSGILSFRKSLGLNESVHQSLEDLFGGLKVRIDIPIHLVFVLDSVVFI